MNDAQVSYALIRARIEVRLAELRAALERHEADRANWTRTETLERVEAGLATLAKGARVKDILARYRAMQRWVARERRRLERTSERPSQRYLRRARLLMEVDALTMRELVRELRSVR